MRAFAAGSCLAFCAAIASLAAGAQSAKSFNEPAERKKLEARMDKMDFWAYCGELGRMLRKPDISPRGELWEKVMVSRAAGISSADFGYIRDRRLRVGMDQCSVAAILGKPSEINRTNHAGGFSDQWAYWGRGVYVYLDNGVVRAWQE